MKRPGIVWFLITSVLLVLAPAYSQSLPEGGSVEGLSVGLGAGAAASAKHGRAIVRSYEAVVAAEQTALLQTKAIQQYMTIGCRFEAKKQWESAEKCFDYVLKVVALRDGPGSPNQVPALMHLVTVSQAENKLGQAINFEQMVVAFKKKAKEPNAKAIANEQLKLSGLFVQNQDYAKAVPLLAEAIAVYKADSTSVAEHKKVCAAYSKVLRKLGKDKEADEIEDELRSLDDIDKEADVETVLPSKTEETPANNAATQTSEQSSK